MFRAEIPALVLNEVSDIFNFCADQEWQCCDDPGEKNLAHAMLQTILEDFHHSVSILTEITLCTIFGYPV